MAFGQVSWKGINKSQEIKFIVNAHIVESGVKHDNPNHYYKIMYFTSFWYILEDWIKYFFDYLISEKKIYKSI